MNQKDERLEVGANDDDAFDNERPRRRQLGEIVYPTWTNIPAGCTKYPLPTYLGYKPLDMDELLSPRYGYNIGHLPRFNETFLHDADEGIDQNDIERGQRIACNNSGLSNCWMVAEYALPEDCDADGNFAQNLLFDTRYLPYFRVTCKAKGHKWWILTDFPYKIPRRDLVSFKDPSAKRYYRFFFGSHMAMDAKIDLVEQLHEQNKVCEDEAKKVQSEPEIVPLDSGSDNMFAFGITFGESIMMDGTRPPPIVDLSDSIAHAIEIEKNKKQNENKF